MSVALARPGLLPAAQRDAWISLGTLILLLVWDASPLDHWLQQPWGDARGFALQSHWFTQRLLHDGGRWLSALLLALLVCNLRWPLWPSLSRAERWRWLGASLLCVGLVSGLKRLSPTSCPWNLREFGGLAERLSHWQWLSADGGPGGCFPSGHAVAAFAFFSSYFALREQHPRQARAWLLAVLGLGLIFGAAQLVRGAHFASHTLWSAWLCWTLCAGLSALGGTQGRRANQGGTPGRRPDQGGPPGRRLAKDRLEGGRPMPVASGAARSEP